MAEPLSTAASVLAVVTFGLQSAKFVHDVLSSLCKSQREFHRTDQAFQSLDVILNHIRNLAQKAQQQALPSALAAPAGCSDGIFEELEKAVKKCVDDLKSLNKRVEGWGKTEQNKPWQKATQAVHMYIRSRDLEDIHQLISRHIEQFNILLNIRSCEHGLEQKGFNAASNLRFDEFSKQVRASTSDIKSHVSTKYERLERISTQHSQEITTGFRRMEILSAQNANNATSEYRNVGDITSKVHDAVERLQQSTDSGVGTINAQLEAMQRMLKDMQSQLVAKDAKNSEEDIDNRLQDCIDRIYDINDKRKGEDVYVDSEEAQEIAEDVVEILKALLDRVTVMGTHKGQGKRKMDDYENDGDEIHMSMQERRTVKRMCGILDSTQSADIRDINWQRDLVPPGRRIQSQSRYVDLPTGSLDFTTIVRKPDNLNLQIQNEKAAITEIFAGSLTLMPKTKKRRMKIRAFFVQNVIRNGAFSISPTISFHAIIPDDSKIFKYIDDGNLEGLIKLLEDGLASLTDCDTYGRSLLGRSLDFTDGRIIKPDVCKYLISKGADVNSFELEFESEPEIKSPLLFLGHCNYWELSVDEVVKQNECMKLFLEAGADPSLFRISTKPLDHGYESSFIQEAVESLDITLLKLALDYDDSKFLLDNQNNNGETALLRAICHGYGRCSYNASLFTEISFEQTTLLLQHGANATAKTHSGQNSLHNILTGNCWYRRYERIYRPHRLLTDLIVLLIEGGADIFARDNQDNTPSHVARMGGYERSWQEALAKCGHCLQEVYKKSNVIWKEIPEVSIEEELAEVICVIGIVPPPFRCKNLWGSEFWKHMLKMRIIPQWRDQTLRSFLLQGTKSGIDIYKQIQPGITLSHYARANMADREWSTVLEQSGHNPKEVYNKSGVEWWELGDGMYGTQDEVLDVYGKKIKEERGVEDDDQSESDEEDSDEEDNDEEDNDEEDSNAGEGTTEDYDGSEGGEGDDEQRPESRNTILSGFMETFDRVEEPQDFFQPHYQTQQDDFFNDTYSNIGNLPLPNFLNVPIYQAAESAGNIASSSPATYQTFDYQSDVNMWDSNIWFEDPVASSAGFQEETWSADLDRVTDIEFEGETEAWKTGETNGVGFEHMN